MTPVMQTIFRIPGGNCFQACVASIFDLPLAQVPHFLENSDGGRWKQEEWDALRKFAEEHNREACWLDPDIPEKPGVEDLFASELYYIATGKSSPYSEFGHCVVGCSGQIVHDPMPDRQKPLASDPWLYIFFPQRSL